MTVTDAWVDFLAGWCSGAVSVLALQPLDTVLTRWQASTALVVGAANTSAAPPTTTTATNTLNVQTSLQVARSLTSKAGWWSLWRGSSPMIGAVPLQNALLMGGYGVGQNYVDRDHPNRLTAIFVGGCTGGVLQSFLMSPVEFVKVSTQIQHATAPPLSTKQLVRKLTGNIPTGLGATLLRDGIPHGVWFAAYEVAKSYLQNNPTGDVGNPGTSPTSTGFLPPLLAGGFAATVAWAVGYPADLIKTRIQAGTSTGIWNTASTIIVEHGLRGLYRGFALKLVRAIPASMIGFGTYELVKGEIQATAL